MAMLLCLLAIVSAIPWSGAVFDHPAFTFNCSTENNVAIIRAGVEQSLQDICDDDILIEYDPTMGTALGSTSQLKISFSSNDSSNPQPGDSTMTELFAFTIGSITSKWTPTGIDKKMLITKKLCGTGYLSAVIEDNGQVIAGAEGRAVMICDNSDVDVALEGVPNTTISLTAHNFPDVIQHLKQNGILGNLHLQMLTGSLPTVTQEAVHWIFVYLRYPYSPRFHKGYDVPDYKIGDVIIGTANFSGGIDAGGKMDLGHLINGKPIKLTSMMCGHMELVFMFDPLKTDSDSNEFNDFKVINVDVVCKDLPAYIPEDTMCHVISNPISSNEVWALYDHRVYSYEDSMRSWNELLPGNPDRQNLLFGMSRVTFAETYLKNLYKHPNTGLCRFVKEKIPEMAMGDDSVVATVSPSALNTKIDNVISQMKTTADMSEVEKAINNIETEFGSTMDIYSVAQMLNSLKDFTRTSNWYTSAGLMTPKNYTRLLFSSYFHGMAAFVHVDPTNSFNIEHTMLMLNITLKYMVGTSYFDKIVFMKLKMARKGLQEMMNTQSAMSHYDCPFGKKIPPPLRILYKLGNVYDGENDDQVDQTSITYCHDRLMATYMRLGGARIQSKDIAKMMQTHVINPIPSVCKQHPFDDMGSPIRVSKKKKDGVIALGGYNPLSKTFTWKAIARCRCDTCMTDYSSHSNPMWTTSTPMWTTSSMQYRSTTTQGP